VLLDVLQYYQPSPEAVSKVAEDEAAAMLRKVRNPDGPFLQAENILNASLLEIYQGGSVLHALASADSTKFRSVAAAGFFEWLLGQQSYGKISISQIPTCPSSGSSMESTAREGSEDIPYSRVAAPGTIKLSFSLDESAHPWALHRALIVGTPKPKGIVPGLNTPDVRTSTKKYCNQRRSFVIDEKSDQAKMLKVLCLREVLHGMPWVVFFATRKTVRLSQRQNRLLRRSRKIPSFLDLSPKVLSQGGHIWSSLSQCDKSFRNNSTGQRCPVRRGGGAVTVGGCT